MSDAPYCCCRTRVLLAALVLAALAPQSARAEAPTTTVGSLAPDIALEDITYTLRASYFRSATVSPHDPNVAYVASWDGYVWKTIDGGKTWQESRIIVEQRPFYGDQGEKTYFGVHRSDGADRTVVLPALGWRNFLDGTLTDASQPFSVNFRMTSSRAAKGDAVLDNARGIVGEGEAAGGTSGAGGNTNFGIGLPGSSPRLQLLVRKLGKPTSGVNMKQTLVLRGTRSNEIRIVVIHPHDPNIVFACSAFGLYRSADAGTNWIRVYSGTKPSDRFAFHLAVDPKDGKRVLLGSGDGLWISTDGGNSFSKATQGGVGGGAIFWVYFNPFDPKYIFAGTDSGLLRSSDNGATWDYIYFTTFPAARVVTYIEIDPHDKKTGYITTADGLFTTPDLLHGGLESWSRLGGLRFSGIVSEKVHACPKHKGHLWTYTNLYVRSVASGGNVDSGGAYIMESLDGGQNWRVINSGNTFGAMDWFENDPKDPDLLWIIWSRSLSRMKRVKPEDRPTQQIVIPDDPPISDVLMAAQMYTGLDVARQFEYRERANWKALVPQLTAKWRSWHYHDYGLQQSGLYPTLPFRFEQPLFNNRDEFRVMAVWNIGDLIFNLDRTNFGRIDRLTYEAREQSIKFALHRFYSELRRLRVLMANDPPKDLRVRLHYRVRMEELISYVNFITGNYLTYWWQGHRTPGIEAKWWVPWTRDRR